MRTRKKRKIGRNLEKQGMQTVHRERKQRRQKKRTKRGENSERRREERKTNKKWYTRNNEKKKEGQTRGKEKIFPNGNSHFKCFFLLEERNIKT